MRQTTCATIDHAVLWLLPATLLGCGSVDGGSGTAVGIQDAPAQIAQAVCPKAYICCMASQLMGNDLAGTDEPSCEAKTTQGFQNNLAGVQASQKMGRSLYDADKLTACVATIRSSTCEMLDTTNHFTGIPGCDSFVRPLVALGGACGNDFECTDGWCAHAPMTVGDGICQAFGKAGDPCNDSSRCASGAVCDSRTQTCFELGAPGAPCALATDCASAICTPPASGSGSGTCAGPRADACFYSSACAAAGWGRPSALSALVLAAALATALARRRRRGGATRTRPSCRA